MQFQFMNIPLFCFLFVIHQYLFTAGSPELSSIWFSISLRMKTKISQKFRAMCVWIRCIHPRFSTFELNRTYWAIIGAWPNKCKTEPQRTHLHSLFSLHLEYLSYMNRNRIDVNHNTNIIPNCVCVFVRTLHFAWPFNLFVAFHIF